MASRLLKNAEVRKILDRHLEKVENGMGTAEILERLTLLARTDLNDFAVKITPEMAKDAIAACGSDKEKAKYALSMIEGRGVGLDIPTALLNGKGPQVQEVIFDHDSAGMPKVKLKLHDPHKSLVTLAKIKGMLRDEAPPASPTNVTVNVALASLSNEQLAALNAAMEQAEAKVRAIPVEAYQVTGKPPSR
jgi:hypothetical protein